MEPTDFPKILGFCCRWCSYAGADLAGSMRLQYPPEIRIMLVPCTGRVDILHVLRAFELGFDAVFVSGPAGLCKRRKYWYWVRRRIDWERD